MDKTDPNNLKEGVTLTGEKVTPIKQALPGVFRKTFLTSIIFIIPVILLSAYLIYLYFKPQNVMDRALLKTSNADYIGYQGRIVTSMEGEYSLISIIIPNSYGVTADVNGVLNFKDKKYPKLLTHASLLIQGLFRSDLELRSFPGNIYIKAKSIPDFGIVNADTYLNRWIKLTLPEDKNLSESKVSKDKVFGKRPIRATENKGKSMIDNKEHFNYKFEIDKDAFFDLLTYYYGSTGKNLTDSDLKTMEKLKERLRFTDGNVWINKKDLYIKRFTLVGQLWPGETSSSDVNSKRIIHFNMDITLSNINMPVEIPEPEDAVTINQILGI